TIVLRVVDAGARVVRAVRAVRPDERGVDVARRDEHAADVLTGVRQRSRAGQTDQAHLGGAVAGATAARPDGRERSEINDDAAASTAHRRDRGLDAQKRAGQDRADDAVPLLLGLLVEADPEVGARVVAQDRDRPQL